MKYKNIAACLIAATCTFSSLATAHDYDHSFSCDTNIHGEMNFANNQFVVTTEQNQTVRFDNAGLVEIDGKTINLTSEQQSLTQQYYNDVEAAIPMVVDITIEALNITEMALTKVFTGLLGENSKLPAMISEKLQATANAIEEHVYQNPQSITFNTAYMEHDLGLDKDLDAEIEELQEEIMSTAMGEIFMMIGQAMIGGDTDFSNFEERMENLGEEIEQQADVLAKELEYKADDLCETLGRIDQTETQLQSIPALKHLNLISVNNKA